MPTLPIQEVRWSGGSLFIDPMSSMWSTDVRIKIKTTKEVKM
jgi:hypothetical protein